MLRLVLVGCTCLWVQCPVPHETVTMLDLLCAVNVAPFGTVAQLAVALAFRVEVAI